LLLLALAWLIGCVHTEKREAFPEQARNAQLTDASGAVPYRPLDPQRMLALRDSMRKSSELQAASHGDLLPPVNVLAISGGGSYGAFDVGVLSGWSDSGTRPTFDIVTGVSTGALIATYAFLGPQYDDKLRDAYVYLRAEDVYETRPWITILTSESVARSTPLKKKIDDAVTPKLLAEVAAAHKAGRRLYVGTTNLDARRFVIWDMGAIAARGGPDAIQLYRQVILASASVPGFFPPVLIDVEIDGQRYKEMHVDGGATTSVFVPMVMSDGDPSDPHRRRGSAVYVISSGKLFADPSTVKQRFTSITYDAIETMLYSGSRGDINRIFDKALLCGMDFHLIAIPCDFPLNADSLAFEPSELRKLFDLGCEMGKTRNGWRETPPGAEINEQTLPRTGTKFRLVK
jgi:hypothetical protein